MAFADEANQRELVALIRDSFPPMPVPPYPPRMGLDPIGVDEFERFANIPWPDASLEWYASEGYDISPAVGFSGFPSMWNYHLPGFMTAALTLGDRLEIVDGFLSSMQRVPPAPIVYKRKKEVPWWAGNECRASYSRAQSSVVVRFLEFVRDKNKRDDLWYEWTQRDEILLQQKWSDYRIESTQDPNHQQPATRFTLLVNLVRGWFK